AVGVGQRRRLDWWVLPGAGGGRRAEPGARGGAAGADAGRRGGVGTGRGVAVVALLPARPGHPAARPGAAQPVRAAARADLRRDLRGGTVALAGGGGGAGRRGS